MYKEVSAGRRDIATYIFNNFISSNGYSLNHIRLDMLEKTTEEECNNYSFNTRPSVN